MKPNLAQQLQAHMSELLSPPACGILQAFIRRLVRGLRFHLQKAAKELNQLLGPRFRQGSAALERGMRSVRRQLHQLTAHPQASLLLPAHACVHPPWETCLAARHALFGPAYQRCCKRQQMHSSPENAQESMS